MRRSTVWASCQIGSDACAVTQGRLGGLGEVPVVVPGGAGFGIGAQARGGGGGPEGATGAAVVGGGLTGTMGLPTAGGTSVGDVTGTGRGRWVGGGRGHAPRMLLGRLPASRARRRPDAPVAAGAGRPVRPDAPVAAEARRPARSPSWLRIARARSGRPRGRSPASSGRLAASCARLPSASRSSSLRLMCSQVSLHLIQVSL